ncbi:hypothetical protein HWI79_3002 [Cryptosporidium felis]|nr:hypothetical protein HWI79_3002 [Cryptosporidium felis]
MKFKNIIAYVILHLIWGHIDAKTMFFGASSFVEYDILDILVNTENNTKIQRNCTKVANNVLRNVPTPKYMKVVHRGQEIMDLKTEYTISLRSSPTMTNNTVFVIEGALQSKNASTNITRIISPNLVSGMNSTTSISGNHSSIQEITQ